MRKLILKMHISLDGLVEAPHKDMSWMQPDTDEVWESLFSLLKNVDLFVLGRGMWKEYRDYWTNALSGTGATANEIKYAKLASQMPHIIFSKSLKQSGWPNATINSGNLNKAISKLKKQPGKDIQIVGGAKFAAALIDSGLVDEYHLNIEPVILAKGKSVFAKLINRNTLRLTAVNKFQNGVVHVVYEQLDSRNTDKAKPGKRRDKKS